MKPFTMKPLISSVERLTSQNSKTPPGITIVSLVSQDPILDMADTGYHLIIIEPEDKAGRMSDEIKAGLTMRETGVSFPEVKEKKEIKERAIRGVSPLLPSRK